VEIDIVTLFPPAFEWFERQRHVANAVAAGTRLTYLDPRRHTPLSAGQVDDTPFGGGAGMVLTPGGRLLDDALVDELAAEPALTLLCGRYEGFDQRVLDHFVSDEVSIGRYVLAGGELAAMVLCDAVLRKLPGSLGHAESAVEESFSAALGGAPEYPHYTRPAEWRGWQVPEVLLSGHHARIDAWRHEESRRRAAAAGGERSADESLP
jgi:tRNA (guanine37-N1)-methyltransferase